VASTRRGNCDAPANVRCRRFPGARTTGQRPRIARISRRTGAVRRLLIERRMAQPRIRDFLTYLTSLPASMTIAVCLFLPHSESCSSHRTETAFESGTWAAILPIILIALLPIVWRITKPEQRHGVPELLLAFTILMLSLIVVAIPLAIYLMWGYSKRTFRGELLTAMCSAALVLLWLFFYPLLLGLDTWLPAAKVTWGAGVGAFVGMVFWTSAAASRPVDGNADAARRLQPKRSPLHFILSV
jgi:hypothetical protein